MKYVFNEEYDKSIADRILSINNVSYSLLEIEKFSSRIENEVVSNFINKLLENRNDKFLIVGDFDCDGICSTAIIKKIFDSINIKSNFYIPSRKNEGYGINKNIVKKAYDNKFDCIVCVDNGIIANDQINYAYELGLKVFIIDHHEYVNLPRCEAVLHPDLLEKDYYDLCAGGLCCLLASQINDDDLYFVYGGLATLADMVNMFGYNRYLACKMLSILKEKEIKPINLLLAHNEVSFTNIQYNVIPKINAVSRLEDIFNVNYVVNFLLERECDLLDYYHKIEINNDARREYSRKMLLLADELVDDSKQIIIIKSKEFKEGLCGLVANKLVDKYSKPVIVFAEGEELLKGSGRSVPGFNLYQYLFEIKDIFETYGGHEGAVGMSIASSNIQSLFDYIDSHKIEFQEQYKDVILLSGDDLKLDILKQINSLEPYGSNFATPLFGVHTSLIQKKYVVSNRFPKYDINEHISAINFKSGNVNDDYDYLIGKITKDTYNPNKLSLIIEDLI